MKKLYMLIGILFTMIYTNCMAIGNDDQQNDLEYWSNDLKERQIQKLIHGQHENEKFEVIHKPIRIDKLAKIVLSFLNAEESVSYIIIGIAEDLYSYRKMSKTSFETLKDKKDGIYRIDDEGKNIKYYQIINNKISELKLRSDEKGFFTKKLFKMDTESRLTFREWRDIFYDVNRNTTPVDTNMISYIGKSKEINIGVDSDKILMKFNNSESYIEHLKKYIKHNTNPQIDFDKYINTRYIEVDGINKIIILEIKSHENSIVINTKDGSSYGRYNNNGNHGVNFMNAMQIQNMQLKRNHKRMESTLLAYDTTTVDDPEIKKFFDYIYSGDMDSFNKFLEQHNLDLELLKDSVGNNALMIAAHCGQTFFVKSFLENKSRFKFDPYQLNRKHENILLIAVSNNKKEVVKLLLERHPELFKEVNQFGSNAFLVSCKNGNWDITEYFLRNVSYEMLTETDLKNGLVIINKLETTKENSEQISTIKQLINNLINYSYEMPQAIEQHDDIINIEKPLLSSNECVIISKMTTELHLS